MTTDAEDRSTWPRNGQRIRRAELLRLIEENGGPAGLDLRGAVFVAQGPLADPIDLTPEALAPLAAAYRDEKGGQEPPWLAPGGGLYLVGAHLQEAALWNAQLQGAQLSYAQLQGAQLTGSQLQDTYLPLAQLQAVDMYGVTSLEGAVWNGAFLDHTRIRRNKLGEAIGDEADAHEMKTAEAYHSAKEAYLLLKNNFNQIGRYEDASWAYVKEQQMEKMAFHWEWRGHGWRVWRRRGSFWRWLRNWAYELLTGYGEHPWRPALWAVLVVAVFTAVYAGAGNTAPDFAGDPAAAQGSHSLADAFTHSLASFVTIGFNTLEPLGWVARLLTAVESALGIGLFALFIFTIGNRMSRG